MRFSARVRVDLKLLLDELDRLKVPLKFTQELDEIYFTYLPKKIHGDYRAGKMRISCSYATRFIIPRVFVHELAHHVDDMEDISGDEGIISEKRTNAQYIGDTYARKNVSEYVAVGFETYYCGSKDERSLLRKKNPLLYRAISRVHRKYGG